MSKNAIPFSADDISTLARSLRNQLGEADRLPGHVEMLNMLARAAGHRNFQSLRAQQARQDVVPPQPPAEEPVDAAQIQRLARYFDAQGQLASWPARSSLQVPCLWALWSKLPSGAALSEDDFNRRIRALHRFGDHALLRRELCDKGLVTRSADGRQYQRVERKPSPEGLALIRHLGAHARPAKGGRQ